jgi:hypothetical protein
LEVGELMKVCEGDVSALCMAHTDRLVEENDSLVLLLRNGCKEASDVFVVSLEFGISVTENEDGSIGCGVPGNCPFAVRGYLLRWSARTCGDLNVPDPLCSFGVTGETEKPGEDMIEVDCTPRDEVCPFG